MPADPPKDAGEALKGAKRCPDCGKPAENPKTLPFCSSRCRDVDLNRWLSGRYVIPGKENQGEDEE